VFPEEVEGELPLVSRRGSIVIVASHGRSEEYPVVPLCEVFIDWQIRERVMLFETLKAKGHPSFFPPHLPVLLTMDLDVTPFPVNAACKGIGLVALDAGMDSLSSRFESVMSSARTASLEERIQSALLFYGCPDLIDRTSLGGLEIFEAHSLANIKNHPFVSLFYTGSFPEYVSYQIDCVAELTTEGHPFYRFVRSMRNLFEDAAFHIQQPIYPYAVRYHVIAVHDKSLKLRDLNASSGRA
jgi:hypothetical protein